MTVFWVQVFGMKIVLKMLWMLPWIEDLNALIRELEPVSTTIRQHPCGVPPSLVLLLWGSLPVAITSCRLCVSFIKSMDFSCLIGAQLSFRLRCSGMLLLGAVQPFISTPGGSWDYWVGKTGVMAQLLSVTRVADEMKIIVLQDLSDLPTDLLPTTLDWFYACKYARDLKRYTFKASDFHRT